MFVMIHLGEMKVKDVGQSLHDSYSYFVCNETILISSSNQNNRLVSSTSNLFYSATRIVNGLGLPLLPTVLGDLFVWLAIGSGNGKGGERPVRSSRKSGSNSGTAPSAVFPARPPTSRSSASRPVLDFTLDLSGLDPGPQPAGLAFVLSCVQMYWWLSRDTHGDIRIPRGTRTGLRSTCRRSDSVRAHTGMRTAPPAPAAVGAGGKW